MENERQRRERAVPINVIAEAQPIEAVNVLGPAHCWCALPRELVTAKVSGTLSWHFRHFGALARVTKQNPV